MPPRLLALLLTLSLLLSLTACGYKGELTLPGEPEQEQPDGGKERRSSRR